MYALQSLLIPSTTNAISGKYLIYLQSKSSTKTFNWCALVMYNLVHYLNTFVERSGKNPIPSGNFHCLVQMFYDMMKGSVYKDRHAVKTGLAMLRILLLHLNKPHAHMQQVVRKWIRFLERTIEMCKQEIEEKDSLCKYEAELAQLKVIANQGKAKRPRRCPPGPLLSTSELKTEY